MCEPFSWKKKPVNFVTKNVQRGLFVFMGGGGGGKGYNQSCPENKKQNLFNFISNAYHHIKFWKNLVYRFC